MPRRSWTGARSRRRPAVLPSCRANSGSMPAGRPHQGPCGRGLVLLAVDQDRRIGRILHDAPDLPDLLVARQRRHGHIEVAQQRELGHRPVVLAGCDRGGCEIDNGAKAHRLCLYDAEAPQRTRRAHRGRGAVVHEDASLTLSPKGPSPVADCARSGAPGDPTGSPSPKAADRRVERTMRARYGMVYCTSGEMEPLRSMPLMSAEPIRSSMY
jgi:hypothetical protein